MSETQIKGYWHKRGSLVKWTTENGKHVYVKKASNGWYQIRIDDYLVAIAKGQKNAQQVALKFALLPKIA